MKKYDVRFELSYSGADADEHEIDFYDISQALLGFQRSLAITTHLVLNGEIITQAPSLKGAKIFAFPPEEGSWKTKAGILILGTAAYNLGTLPSNTPLGHLVFSESLGFHVDYNKSLGQLYEDSREKNIILPEVREAQLDSVIEKCSTAITEMHRPIYKTKTANTAQISANINSQQTPLQPTLSFESFQYLIEEFIENEVVAIRGFVSSYNSNTFKGRIYVPEEERPISFELSDPARGESSIQLIVDSLRANALRGFNAETIEVYCWVQRVISKSGHLKKYKVLVVSSEMFTQ